MAEGVHAPRKRAPLSQSQQHLERIDLLPKPKQRAVSAFRLKFRRPADEFAF